jgi:hypothetical protein
MRRFARVVAIAPAAALLGLSLSLGASAQTITLDQYQHPKTAKDLSFNKAYLVGAADGLIAYNLTAEKKLFCPPGEVVPHLDFERANDIVIRWGRKMGGGADLPVGRVLLYGLTKAFPCH